MGAQQFHVATQLYMLAGRKRPLMSREHCVRRPRGQWKNSHQQGEALLEAVRHGQEDTLPVIET